MANVNVFEEEIVPSYNVAPQTFQPVIRFNRDSGELELTVMRWGLVPWWSKDGKAGFSAINAKAETLTKSAAFREAFQRRRCLVCGLRPAAIQDRAVQPRHGNSPVSFTQTGMVGFSAFP
jgi:putative SOS response-associated peptidase YedK